MLIWQVGLSENKVCDIIERFSSGCLLFVGCCCFQVHNAKPFIYYRTENILSSFCRAETQTMLKSAVMLRSSGFVIF